MALFKRTKATQPAVSLESAAGAVHDELAAEVPIVEGPVRDLSLNGAPAFLAVTETSFVWALGARPDVVLRGEFSRVFEIAEQDQAIKLTSRDPAYAAMLRDPSNPRGETDAMFFYGTQDPRGASRGNEDP